MKLRSIEIEKRFVPQFNDNRDLPPDEQVVIFFKRIPGTSEKSNYKSFRMDSKSGVEMLYNDQMLVAAFVDRIENLTIEIKGKSDKKVKNGQELAEVNNSMLSDLFTEIRDYLFPDSEDLDEGESEA